MRTHEQGKTTWQDRALHLLISVAIKSLTICSSTFSSHVSIRLKEMLYFGVFKSNVLYWMKCCWENNNMAFLHLVAFSLNCCYTLKACIVNTGCILISFINCWCVHMSKSHLITSESDIFAFHTLAIFWSVSIQRKIYEDIGEETLGIFAVENGSIHMFNELSICSNPYHIEMKLF